MEGFYCCASLINSKAEDTMEKEYKRHHGLGLSIPESVLLSLLAGWSADCSRLAAAFDSWELVRADKALKGKYRSGN